MVWTHWDSRTGQRTYRSGPNPYDQWGFEADRPIWHSGENNAQSYTYTSDPRGGVIRWDWVADPVTSGSGTNTATAPAPSASVVTGIDPGEISNALYGKIIPLSALGLARLGLAGLIWGPYINAGLASFAVSFGFPANPEGTRRVYEVSLDSRIAWELTAGSPAGPLDAAGFLGTPFTCRFYSGTMTQPADPLEAAMFGAQAVAYRPQMTLWFENLPVAPYDGKLPFVSAKFGDVTDGAVPADGINLGHALEMVAYSPWLEYDSTSFETVGVADIVQAMILSEDQSFLNMLRVVARVYRTLDILQTDMLRVSDRGATVTPDLSLHRDHISAGASVSYMRQEEASVPRELELNTIDPDADYVFMPFKVARPLAPVPVTSSVSKDSITLPVVVGATTRASLVTYAKYQEENARKRVSLQLMAYGYQMEPGDLFNLTDPGEGLDPSEIFKVVESNHGANYINEIVGEAILKCAIYFDAEADPWYLDNLILLHANSASPVVDNSQHDYEMVLDRGATVDTAVSRFGAGSFYFDGTSGHRVQTVSGLLDAGEDFEYYWDFNITPFTVECWVRFGRLNHPTAQIIVCRNGGLIAFRFWHFYNPANTNEISFQTLDGVSLTSTTVTTDADLIIDTWYHIAADKDSIGRIRVYINGVMKAICPVLDPYIGHSVEELTLGDSGFTVSQNPLLGWIDDLRITRRSRYGDIYGDGGFAPPTAPFADHI